MARADKVAAVAEMTERFQRSSGAVLTEYRGLSVAQLGELRRSLGEHATFAALPAQMARLLAALQDQRASEAQGSAPEDGTPEDSGSEDSAPEDSTPEDSAEAGDG